jgi:hypothetical protein
MIMMCCRHSITVLFWSLCAILSYPLDFRFYGGDYEDYCLLGCDAVESGRTLPAFRKNPCLLFRVEMDGGGRILHHYEYVLRDYSMYDPIRQ